MRMKSTVFDLVGVGGWTTLSIPIIWVGLVYVWDQIFGERDRYLKQRPANVRSVQPQ